MSSSAFALIELLLMFGLVIALAAWQWWDWKKWKRSQQRHADKKRD